MNGVGPTDPRSARLRRAAATLGVLGVLLLSVGLPAAAPISAAAHRGAAAQIEYARALAAPPVVRFVNMTDAPAFVPAALTGGVPGGNVTIHLRNLGSYAHSFTVASRPGVLLDPTWTPAKLDAWFNANGSLANVSVAPGANTTLTLLVPATSPVGASFEFVSVVPYQFQAGMRGFLNLTAGPGTILDETTLDTLHFSPDTLVVNATSYPVTIDVQVSNRGSDTHTWTLVPQAGVLLTFSNYSTYFQAHPPLASVSVPNYPTAVWANFSIPAKGVYEYICTVSGHFAGGMNGSLWVGLLPPPSAAPLSTAIVQEGVLLGAGILLAIATFLAFVANYVGRVAPAGAAPRH